MKKNTVLIILVLIVIGFMFYRSMGSSFGASGAMNTLSVKNESGDYLFVVITKDIALVSPLQINGYSLDVSKGAIFIFDVSNNLIGICPVPTTTNSWVVYFSNSSIPMTITYPNLDLISYFKQNLPLQFGNSVFNVGYMNPLINVASITGYSGNSQTAFSPAISSSIPYDIRAPPFSTINNSRYKIAIPDKSQPYGSTPTLDPLSPLINTAVTNPANYNTQTCSDVVANNPNMCMTNINNYIAQNNLKPQQINFYNIKNAYSKPVTLTFATSGIPNQTMTIPAGQIVYGYPIINFSACKITTSTGSSSITTPVKVISQSVPSFINILANGSLSF